MKAAIVVNRELPVGIIANASAVLGISLGAMHPDVVGDDLTDASGTIHRGITGLPVPILSSPPDDLADIVLRASAVDQLDVVGFTDVARRCTDYEDYGRKLADVPTADLRYVAVLVVGSKKAVNKLTGSLPLVG